MAFLDWIKDRLAAKQQPVAQTQQRPETAKQVYAREAAQEAATRKPVSQMPEADKAEARRLGRVIQDSGKPGPETTPPRAVVPQAAESATNPQPMRQNMVAQHNDAPAMSPTSGQHGHEHQHTGAPTSEPAKETPKPSPKPPQPTVPRRSPSWER